MTTSLILEDHKSLENKVVLSLTFFDIVSLTIDAARKISRVDKKWKNIYEQYHDELDAQTKLGWPVMSTSENYSSKCTEIVLSKPFRVTKNFLVYLYRLVLIESYKEQKLLPYNYFYHNEIIKHNIPVDAISHDVRNLQICEIVNSLIEHLKRYIRIYKNQKCIEYSLATEILAHLI